MRRLPNLRNADDKYRKVSVKDDYTIEEREIIKECQELANKKNEEENTDDAEEEEEAEEAEGEDTG